MPTSEVACPSDASALRKVGSRLIPFLWLMYFAAFLDRTSVGFAALQVNRELGFSASVYGLGAGIFFFGYCLFEVPSNLVLHRVGAPRWLARIMLSWALVAILSMNGAWGISGWQWLYVLETLPSLALGLVTVAYLPNTPSAAPWLSPAEKAGLHAILDAERAQKGSGHKPSVLESLSSPTVIGLSLCYFGVEIGLYGVIFWIPEIFSQIGIRPALLGWAVAVPYACAAVGMVWWSRHSDRHGERNLHLLTASIAGFLGLAISALVAKAPTISLLAITLGATGTLAVLPIFWTRPTTLLGGAAGAGAIALINAVGNVGGFVGPYVMGSLRDTTGGFTGGLLVAACGVLMTGIFTILMSRRLMPREVMGSNNEF